jgi:hypothetical protein
MNPSNDINDNRQNEEFQPPIIHRQAQSTTAERLEHGKIGETEEDDHLSWLMTATPRVSWDDSDGCRLTSPSCTKEIKLSPPPLLTSQNRNFNRSFNGNRSDSVLSLPSLDVLGDLQQPVLCSNKRKSVVGDDSPMARWRLRHRSSSDPLDYLLRPPYLPPRPLGRPQQCTTFMSNSSSAKQPSFSQQQLAVLHDQPRQQPQKLRQQKRGEEGIVEEEDEFTDLLQLQEIDLYDQHGQQPKLQQQQQQRCEEDTDVEEDELIDLLLQR